MRYVVHPRIVPDRVEERAYQTDLVGECVRCNTLLILPTALGKTIVALNVAVRFLDKGKVLLLAPTKPLLDQHASTFADLTVDTKVGIINGTVAQEKRAMMIESSDVVIATSQTVANDLAAKRYDLSGFSLVIYDEAHRAVGEYDYVNVAMHCDRNMRSIGMTASPGSSMAKIKEVCDNLDLDQVRVKYDSDPDVVPYIHDTAVERVVVNIPEDLRNVIIQLELLRDHYVKELVGLGAIHPDRPVSRTYLLAAQASLKRRLDAGERTAVVFRGLAADAICMRVMYCIELAETQSMSALRAYMSKLEAEADKDKGGRSAKELVNREEFIAMKQITANTNTEHPKISKVMSLVSQTLSASPGSKIMVFTKYRETVDLLTDRLSRIPDAKVGRLIGQSSGGLKQKEQIDVLDRFRSGELNVIVSTSVGEEGLDVTSTDAVIFYEPLPSEIRTIQRRGRTGRKNDGRVFLLIARGTMDEIAEKTSERKEEMMRKNLDRLNSELRSGPRYGRGRFQTDLNSF